MVDDGSSEALESKEHSPAGSEPEHRFREIGHYVPRAILDVSFPVSVRGYDRRAVDAHLERVNRVIADLKVRASPPAAVRHALDQASEKVEGLLQAAREAAEEITASARAEAEESTDRAKSEAAKLLVNTSAEADRLQAEAQELIASAKAEAEATIAKAKVEASQILAEASAEASHELMHARAEADERVRRLEEELAARREVAEARMREIQADTEAVWKERHEMVDDIGTMASRLVDLANAAAARSQRREPAPPLEEMPQPEAGGATESPEVATESAPSKRPVASEERAQDVS